VPATATVDSVKLSRDKLESHIEFYRVGIPTPYSVAPTGRSPEKAKKMFELVEPDKSKKMIIKTATGSLGKGVVLAESRRSAVTQVQAFEARKIRYFVQEFLESPEPEYKHSDIRLFVIDGLIVASMMRQSSDEDEIRANLDLGAKGFEYEPTPREEDLALRAYDVIGAKVAGVDIMKSHRGPLVVEVNTNPGFGIEKVTSKNVAAGIVDLAIKGAEQRS
jgi:ribosomal protein S6--L-glutamate ligase